MRKRFFFCLILVFLFPVSGGAQETKKKARDNEPLVINSDTLEIDNKKQTVLFTGRVDARKSGFAINCQEMLVYYKGKPSVGKNKESKTTDEMKLDRVIATGNVKITREDGGIAMSDKAVYFQDEEKVILTGRPVVKQGKDFVEGNEITFFLKEKRSIVKGSKRKKVRAVLYPGKR
jgi:lipopolysaccharide export system protein LptA